MGQKILVADDSITIQKVIGLTFASEDYELEMADNGDEALEKAHAAPPDLIIADTNMPGLSGYELCERLRATPDLAHIPLILLTGTYEVFDEERAQQVGANDHLTKPFESAALIEKVRQLLAAAAAPSSQPDAATEPAETTPHTESAPAGEAATPVEEATADLTGEEFEPIDTLDAEATDDLEEIEEIQELSEVDDFGDLEPVEPEITPEAQVEEFATPEAMNTTPSEGTDATRSDSAATEDAISATGSVADEWDLGDFDAHPAAEAAATDVDAAAPSIAPEPSAPEQVEQLEEVGELEPIEEAEALPEQPEQETSADAVQETDISAADVEAPSPAVELDFSDIAIEEAEAVQEGEVSEAAEAIEAEAPAPVDSADVATGDSFDEFAAIEEASNAEPEVSFSAEVEEATAADSPDLEPAASPESAPAPDASGDPFAEFAAMTSDQDAERAASESVAASDDVFAEFAAMEAQQEPEPATSAASTDAGDREETKELVVEAPDADIATDVAPSAVDALDIAPDASPGELGAESTAAQLETTLEMTDEPPLPVENVPAAGTAAAQAPLPEIPREQITEEVRKAVQEAIRQVIETEARAAIEAAVADIVRDSLSRALEDIRGKLD